MSIGNNIDNIDNFGIGSVTMLGINLKKLQKEDPAKVRAFLADLCACEEIPPAARNAAKKLLRRYEAGQTLKASLKKEFKEMMSDTKETLKNADYGKSK
jgi:hypothetical protein